MPPDGADPEGKVTVPVLPDLVRLKGHSASGQFVEYVRLRGFSIGETQGGLVSLSRPAHCRAAPRPSP